MGDSQKITVLDLYSGLGGLSLGFELTESFRTLAGLDFYVPAVNTFYSYHDSGSTLFTKPQDIGKLEPARVLDELGAKPDVIVGGPPCQGFSHAGKRLENHEQDERNAQVMRFLHYVNEIRPKAFLMENVSGILLTGQNSRYELMNDLVEAYERIGYSVSFQVLNTSHFRVPQNRRRLILVGIKETRSPFVFPSAVCEDSNLCLGIHEQVNTVADALSDLPTPTESEPQEYELPSQTPLQHFLRRDSSHIYNHLVTRHSPQIIDKLKAQKGGTRLYPTWNHSWYRLLPDKPSPAVKENHRAPFIHYLENRATSPRECARLQTIPDRIRLAGTKTNALILVGNAVPPVFAAHLATELAKQAFGVEVEVPWDLENNPLQKSERSKELAEV